jgi:hypothetical protein
VNSEFTTAQACQERKTTAFRPWRFIFIPVPDGPCYYYFPITALRIPDHPLFIHLRELHLPAKDYVVFGSGPLWVRGIRPGKDLDLLARGKAWDMLKNMGSVEEGDGCSHIIRFDGANIEVFDQWCTPGCNVDEIIDHANVIEGIPFARLGDVLCWKNDMKRKKDKTDVELVEKYLKEHPEESVTNTHS